jgi:RNA polymerase sigma-70 factor (ECF subfamily)
VKLFGKSYRSHSDEDLMSMVIQGNHSAFEEVYNRYSRPILNYFHRMLWKDREKAEDLTQDIFTKIAHRPDQYDPSRPFKTWLYSVANNMCKNEYRKAEVRKNHVGGLHENIGKADDSDHSDTLLHMKMFGQHLQEALNELEDIHRKVFILRFRQNLSINEIADVLEISEGTVKSRIFHAKKKLGELLRQFDPNLKEVYNDN